MRKSKDILHGGVDFGSGTKYDSYIASVTVI